MTVDPDYATSKVNVVSGKNRELARAIPHLRNILRHYRQVWSLPD
jgi:hypothetical protein